MQSRLALNLQQFSILSLSSDEITRVYHYVWLGLEYCLLSELMTLTLGRGQMTNVYCGADPDLGP